MTRALPFNAMLDAEALDCIERQAFRTTREIGLELRGDLAALARWKAAGVDVQETRGQAEEGLVRSFLPDAAFEFEQIARNMDRAKTVG